MLTPLTAQRLKDRLELLDTFKRAAALLPAGWAESLLPAGKGLKVMRLQGQGRRGKYGCRRRGPPELVLAAHTKAHS